VVEHPLIGARGFSLMLVSIGMIALVLATVEYRRNIYALGARSAAISSHSLAVIVAAMISLLGIVALLTMIFRQ
jgi:hypothetical protein